MSKPVRVEWIGVRSPFDDDQMWFRKTTNKLPKDVEDELVAISELITPLIRTPYKTSRRMTEREGFSKEYLWDYRRNRYICEMTELDAERLFKAGDEAEFRNLDDPAHDDRTAVVPERFMTEMLRRYVMGVKNGPLVVVTGRQARATLDEIRQTR